MSQSPLSCEFITPDWPAPANVKALVTTRVGGPCKAPYDAFNVGDYVGDHLADVAECRRQLSFHAGRARFHWLAQVHSATVVGPELDDGVEADASISRQVGEACVVMTADCLPVVMCDRDGTCISAVHAGWKGLLNGVIEASVREMNVSPGELMAWFGPAIGQCCFEVGAEVRSAFIAKLPQAAKAFIPSPHHSGERYMADMYLLARQRLEAIGVSDIHGGGDCTCCDVGRFYSYRRDGEKTGRMATAIWFDAASAQ